MKCVARLARRSTIIFLLSGILGDFVSPSWLNLGHWWGSDPENVGKSNFCISSLAL